MNISGVVVRTRPESVKDVAGRLRHLPGVALHAMTDDGRMVITVEDTTEGHPVSETVLSVETMDGVLSTSLAYHYCDDDLNEKEAMS